MKDYTYTIEVKGKTKKKTVLTFFYKGEKFGTRTSTKAPEAFEAYAVVEKPGRNPVILGVGKITTCEQKSREMNNYYSRVGSQEKAFTILLK